jgi:hypothetical protein
MMLFGEARVLGDRRVRGGLRHHHDQAGVDPVPGHVADEHPERVLEREDVVEVAAHVVGRLHARGDLEPLHRGRDRQDGRLDLVRDLHLAPERLGALELVARALHLLDHHC